MLTTERCQCEPPLECGGFIGRVEVQMNKMDDSRSTQEYHEILELFERAFCEME